ncbi:polysaccharide deacetylase family protein [Flavobacteriaceae bacterium R38]|nr:polysaccharide deacetylase family protein [Flavobacteriaceae bacterium R38]
MKIVRAKTPGIIKKIFSGYTWNIRTRKKTIYLTFDDGPIPGVTEWILDTLSKYNAKATFFCIGNNVTSNPEIYQRILKEGHAVGNHTYNHLKGWNTTKEKYLQNIKEAAIHIDSKLFRPPYGRITSSQAKELRKMGYKIIMWDVLAMDWDANIPKEKCADNVLKNSKEGSIVVFHDSLKAEHNMKYALTTTLDHFSKKGYSFESLDSWIVG